jgi:hypothetical protein
MQRLASLISPRRSIEAFKSSKRFFSSPSASTATATEAQAAPKSAVSSSRSGSTFVERLTSFLAGAGVGFGVNYYIVYEVSRKFNVVPTCT